MTTDPKPAASNSCDNSTGLNPIPLGGQNITLPPQPEQLKALVERLSQTPSYDNQCAAAHLRAYAEQIAELTSERKYSESLAADICKMEDALGFKNDCHDKDGAFIPTIGPWLERLRDLIAAEGELGDIKSQLVQRDARIKELDSAHKETARLLAMTIHQRDNAYRRIKELDGKLFAATYSMQICVGAAGIGDPSELCGWIDNIKAQHEAWRKALVEIEAQTEYEAVAYSRAIARQALNPTSSEHTAGK